MTYRRNIGKEMRCGYMNSVHARVSVFSKTWILQGKDIRTCKSFQIQSIYYILRICKIISRNKLELKLNLKTAMYQIQVLARIQFISGKQCATFLRENIIREIIQDPNTLKFITEHKNCCLKGIITSTICV